MADRPSAVVLAGVAAVLLAGAALVSLLVGARPISWQQALDALHAFDGSPEHIVVREIRLPRTLLALAVGAALAIAGALMQSLTRNPFASPSVLGVSSGAAFCVALAIYVAGITSPLGYVWFALLGALVSAVAVHLLAGGGPGGGPGGWSRDRSPVRLALGGAVLSTMLSSWTYTVMALDRRTADEARFWLAGSLAGRPLGVLVAVLPFLLAGLVLALALIRGLDALALGDEAAVALGVRPVLVRVAGAAAVVLLAGGAVAAAGPIAFVGLGVPHLVRLVTGPGHRRVLPGCLLVGPVVVLAADLLGRVVVAPGELAVGVVSALLGAPVLLVLARHAAVVTR